MCGDGEMSIIPLEKVDSTNIYAKNNLETLEDKTVIHALRQTSGRGRLSRSWVDLGEGNLFLTFVLKPSNKFSEKYSNLTQYLSVVLCDLLEEYGLNPQIKWPNDVLINGKKIAGILSETVMQGDNFKGLVLGIGVNLNSNQTDLDQIPDKIATSLNIELNKSVDMYEFRDKLLEKFYKNYEEFLEGGFAYIRNEYLSRALFINTNISVKGYNDTYTGVVKDINRNGELILEQNNKELVLTIGDIL